MSTGLVALAPIGMGAIGVLAAAASAWRAPAEHRPASRSALVGAAGLVVTATLSVVLPPISFHAWVLGVLIGAGAAAGLGAGAVVRLRVGPEGVVARGGAWHLLPASLALLGLQVAALADNLDAVVLATAAIVACTGLAVGAAVMVAVRGLVVRRRPAVSAGVAVMGVGGTVPAAGLAAPEPAVATIRPGPVGPPGTVRSPSPAGGPPAPRWPRRALVGLVVVAVLALVGFAALRVWDGSEPVAQPSAPASVAPSESVDPASGQTPTELIPAAEPSQPAPTDPATSEPSPASPVALGARYVGMVYANGQTPAGVTELGGALIIGTGHATSWMSGPEGDMFWLLREAGTDADGSVTEWEVRDVVVWPPVTEDSAQVVSGAVRCLVNGADVAGVVAVFPLVDDEWFVDPYMAWWPDTGAGSLVPLPNSTTCVNEAYGV